MKKFIILGLILSLTILLNQTSALSNSCIDSNNVILSLSNASNAHAGFWNAAYPYKVCFEQIFGYNYNGSLSTVHQCNSSANKVLRFYSDAGGSNGHAQNPALTAPSGYVNICYGDLICSLKSSCLSSEKEIVSLSGASNAQSAAPGKSSYLNKICCSRPSGPVGPTPPSIPINVIARNTSSCNSNVNVSWSASNGSGPINYNVWRSTTSGGIYTKLNSGLINTLSYIDSSVTPGGFYYYKVTSNNSAGESAHSNYSQITMPGTCLIPPSQPAWLRTINISCAQGVNLTWPASSGATNYILNRSTSISGPFITINNNNNLSYQDLNKTGNVLTPGSVYYYQVIANNSNGQNASVINSSKITAICITPPAIPSNFQGTAEPACSSSRIRLSWSPSSDATNYIIYNSSVPPVSFTKLNSTTSTTYLHSPLPNQAAGSVYYYKLSANNSAGQSGNVTINVTLPNSCQTDAVPSLFFDPITPNNNSILIPGNPVTIKALANDDNLIMPGSCTLRLNGTVYSMIQNGTGRNINCTWTSNALPIGVYYYNVSVQDNSSQVGFSENRKLIVNNSGSQMQIELRLPTPIDGESISSNSAGSTSITFKAHASSNNGNIASCSLNLDGNIYSVDNANIVPDSDMMNVNCTYTKLDVLVGNHTFSMNAMNANGDAVSSSTVRFSVQSEPLITSLGPAYWANKENAKIQNGFVGCVNNTYHLIVKANNISGGEKINFSIYSGSNDIRTGLNKLNASVDGYGNAIASWKILDEDMNSAGTGSVYNFTFNATYNNLFAESGNFTVVNEECVDQQGVFLPFFSWPQFVIAIFSLFVIYIIRRGKFLNNQ